MNLQQLEYIVAVDKYKNFSKAAESCFITQATLSTMVKKLEVELDLIIFDRKTNPILTTDCGKIIIDEAKKVLLHSEKLIYKAKEIKGKVEGELRIGIIPTVAGNLLPRILPPLLKKYPDLKLIISEITTATILSKLKTNELDAGILSTPIQPNDYECDVLYYEKLMVYGQLEKEDTRYLRPKNLKNEKVWLLEQGHCLSDQIINVCSLNPRTLNSNLNFSPSTFDSLINIVDEFKGLTVIPELYYNELSKHRKSKVHNFNAPVPVREISLVYKRPYAKLRILAALSAEIKSLIKPFLSTSELRNKEMSIAKV